MLQYSLFTTKQQNKSLHDETYFLKTYVVFYRIFSEKCIKNTKMGKPYLKQTGVHSLIFFNIKYCHITKCPPQYFYTFLAKNKKKL